MYQEIEKRASLLKPEIIGHRRALHKIPETAWEEYNTSSYICQVLQNYGWETTVGMPVTGHDTGVMGLLPCGSGPEIVLRFDIDGLPIRESEASDHFPNAAGFASEHSDRMHACGHDGHTAMGLGSAALLSGLKNDLAGTVRLIFQPAEEGCKGAAPIVKTGLLDNADYLLAGHIVDASQYESGADVIPGVHASLATTKLDALFQGVASHASHPEEGASVISAMAAAVNGIDGIPRSSLGATFANIGVIRAGDGRNVIPESGIMQLETRGETTLLNNYMENRVTNILHTAASMWGCSCSINVLGRAPSLVSSPELSNMIKDLCDSKLSSVKSAATTGVFPYSEDAALLMEHVKARDGQAAYLLFPARLDGPLHTPQYDFDESILTKAVILYTSIVWNLLKR